MSISRRCQDDLPRLARRLDADAHRIRQRVFGAIVVPFFMAFGLFWLAVGGDWAASSEVLGWPLLAVADYELVGLRPVLVGDEPCGWISVGMRPTGLVALGLQPTGVIAVGLLPIGAVSVGVVALGLLPLGCVTAGLVSIGTVSAAWLSFGSRLSLGWFALGDGLRKGTSIGAYAWGNRARGLLFEKRRLREALDARLANEGAQSIVPRGRQGDLRRLARRLDGTDAHRLRRCVFWTGVVACAMAIAVSRLRFGTRWRQPRFSVGPWSLLATTNSLVGRLSSWATSHADGHGSVSASVRRASWQSAWCQLASSLWAWCRKAWFPLAWLRSVYCHSDAPCSVSFPTAWFPLGGSRLAGLVWVGTLLGMGRWARMLGGTK